jgi:hypothetical protein
MIPGFNADVRSSGLACDEWSCEWTYTGATGEVTLNTAVGEGGAWTDLDPRVPEATQVVDSGTGMTTVRFPQSRRAKVIHVSIEPAIPATAAQHVRPVVTALNAVAGTCLIIIMNSQGNAVVDPAINAKGRLILGLEHR